MFKNGDIICNRSSYCFWEVWVQFVAKNTVIVVRNLRVQSRMVSNCPRGWSGYANVKSTVQTLDKNIDGQSSHGQSVEGQEFRRAKRHKDAKKDVGEDKRDVMGGSLKILGTLQALDFFEEEALTVFFRVATDSVLRFLFAPPLGLCISRPGISQT